MGKPDFDDYFAGLEKASDRTRSVIYAFIIVYIAVLLYSLSAFAYPARPFTYDYVNLLVRCLDHSEDAECHTVIADVAHTKDPPQLEKAVANALWTHQLQIFYDDSVAVRTFKFPIFGLETDRDLLWLIFPLIGMIAYYIVWLALARLAGMFRFLLGRNRTDAVRLRLIQSTLVITTPLNAESDSELTPFYQAIWRALTLLVFAIPIIVTLLTIADQTNAIAVFVRHVPGEKFMKDPTATFQVKLAFQVLVLLLQLGLLGKLIALSIRFGRDQGEAGRLVASLEASGSAARHDSPLT